MPAKLHWTQARDNQIRQLRSEGASWDSIAEALLLSRFTVIERGRRLGAPKAPPPPPPISPPRGGPPPPPGAPRILPDESGREPLPAGHPNSWRALNSGSSLEGEPYPFPLFR